MKFLRVSRLRNRGVDKLVRDLTDAQSLYPVSGRLVTPSPQTGAVGNPVIGCFLYYKCFISIGEVME